MLRGCIIRELFGRTDRYDHPRTHRLVSQGGTILFARGYGLRKIGNGDKNTPETAFRIASVSKQFTAAIILMLKEQEKLTLSDPLTKHLPVFPAYGNSITIRHLLTHTSGLDNYEKEIDNDREKPVVDAEVYEILKRQTGTLFPPGTESQYSNSAYALLTIVAERVTGKLYRELVHEWIFEPLGMDHSIAHVKGVTSVPDRAYGYERERRQYLLRDQSPTSWVLGDGGLYCSVLDYAKWDRALYAGDVIGRETLADAFTPYRLPDGTLTDYGYGWSISKGHGVTIIGHSGNVTGFSADVRRVPERELLVVVFMNRSGMVAVMLARKILEVVLTQSESDIGDDAPPGK